MDKSELYQMWYPLHNVQALQQTLPKYYSLMIASLMSLHYSIDIDFTVQQP